MSPYSLDYIISTYVDRTASVSLETYSTHLYISVRFR